MHHIQPELSDLPAVHHSIYQDNYQAVNAETDKLANEFKAIFTGQRGLQSTIINIRETGEALYIIPVFIDCR